MGSVGHVSVGFASAVVCLLLAAAIADGQSMFAQKDSQRNYALQGISKQAIGLGWDNRGNTWDNILHPLHFCDEQKRMGQTIQGGSLLSLILLGFSVPLNLLGARSTSGTYGVVSLLCQALACVFLLIAWALGVALHERTYCGVKLRHQYIMSYGIPFLVIGFVVTLVNVIGLVLTGSLKSQPEELVEEERYEDGVYPQDVEY
eukprot:Rhum_TRINITY_DN8119_c0_g10::Rhum_TRINITY_DN8119_c0_g10_i1::g.26390::m.26390